MAANSSQPDSFWVLLYKWNQLPQKDQRSYSFLKFGKVNTVPMGDLGHIMKHWLLIWNSNLSIPIFYSPNLDALASSQGPPGTSDYKSAKTGPASEGLASTEPSPQALLLWLKKSVAEQAHSPLWGPLFLQQEALSLAMEGALGVLGTQKQSNTKSVCGAGQVGENWLLSPLICISGLSPVLGNWKTPIYPEGISYFRILLGQTAKGQTVFPPYRLLSKVTLDRKAEDVCAIHSTLKICPCQELPPLAHLLPGTLGHTGGFSMKCKGCDLGKIRAEPTHSLILLSATQKGNGSMWLFYI